MGKYIVELKKNETLYKATTRESDGTAYVCSAIGTPYTEDAAYAHGYTEAEAKYREIRDKLEKDAYQRGLNDAWECARTIFCTSHGELERIFDLEEDDNGLLWVYHEYTASEAIEKIRQYEQKKEKEEIKVGDEVNAPFGKAIVVNIDSVAERIWLVYADGHGGFEYFKDAPTKTGRHFPEIAEVLAKMKES